MKIRFYIIFAFLIFVIIVQPAFANAGIPMIFISYPAMLIAIAPVVFVESFIYHKYLDPTPDETVIKVLKANCASTIAGFPLAWGLLFAIELLTTGGGCGPGFDSTMNSIITVIVESAWLCPWEDQLYWTVPVALIISLIVAFFVSLLIEFVILKRLFKKQSNESIWKATWVANACSYAVLLFFSIGFLIYSILEIQKT